jgi:hypothetical protein
MSKKPSVKRCAESPQCVSGHRSPRRNHLLALFAMISASSVALAQQLPPGGATTWEIQELEAIVTFLIFDPNDPAVALPKGLRFASAHEVEFPELEEHLKHHPEHSNWAFSFVEFVRPKGFVLDGKAPTLPENGGIGVWFAPVDHSKLVAEISKDGYEAVIAPSPDAVLVLGLWVPDREYVAYMRARGHHAEYGMVTLVKDGHGAFQGEIQLNELNVKASATPHGEVRHEPDPFTQVFFEPGKTVEKVVVIGGPNARERDCTAVWSKQGDHPLSRGVFVGPTFLNIEGPINGSAYRLGEENDR